MNFKEKSHDLKKMRKEVKDLSKPGNTSETIEILFELLRRMNVRKAGHREDTTLREIQELHEEEIKKTQMRKCLSFADMRQLEDE
jgi:CRISPR/Cas system CSM-associated protein Csm2 small subunit